MPDHPSRGARPSRGQDPELVIADVSGVYRRAEHADWPDERLERFTAHIRGPGASEYLAKDEWDEDIDVDAVNKPDAQRIALAAMERDYDEGCTILKVVHRPKGVMYL